MVTDFSLCDGDFEMHCRPALSALQPEPGEPITEASRADFIRYLLGGCKPRPEWKTGLEVELFGFTHCLDRIGQGQLQALLADYAPAARHQMTEGGALVGASAPQGYLSLEPGGQVEFSGNPHASLVELERELRGYLSWLREAALSRGLIFIAVGFDPVSGAGEEKWVPKRRYQIMRPYLRRRGARAWDMMCRTAAVQSSVDYASAEDLAKKYVLGNRLAPVASAIFANSPFRRGRLSGYKSERCAVWLKNRPGPVRRLARGALRRLLSRPFH
jgi:glutamate--cysteine ligase